MFGSMQPVVESVRANSAWALKEVQGILTAEQWKQVPDRIPGGLPP